MSVKAIFECGGCFAIAPGIRPMHRYFESVSGRGYGFGTYHIENAEAVVPKGWVAFDPFTGCCYCPKCWSEIMGDGEVDA